MTSAHVRRCSLIIHAAGLSLTLALLLAVTAPDAAAVPAHEHAADAGAARTTVGAAPVICQKKASWLRSTKRSWARASAAAYPGWHRRHPSTSLRTYRAKVNKLKAFRARHRRCVPKPSVSRSSPVPPAATTPQAAETPPPPPPTEEPPVFHATPWVDPFIGTQVGIGRAGWGGGRGNTSPAAVVPFGMTQMGPRSEDPTSLSGYDHRSTKISGFPVTTLSGSGCSLYQDAPLMPFVGSLDQSPELDRSRFDATFDKADEMASAGYYSVRLREPATQVEVTATTRANLARLTFPRSEESTLLMRSSSFSAGATDASFTVVGDDTLEATVTGGGFCGAGDTYTLHVAMRFDTPFRSFGTWSGSDLRPSTRSTTGGRSGAYLRFDTTTAPTVTAKVAVSWVGIDGAKRNLDADRFGYDFDAMRAAASDAWNSRLGRIEVDGTQGQLRTFYTALYHSFVSPNVVSDADGRYLGFDSNVHETSGWTQYGNFSGWDAYRSWSALLAVFAPDVASDFAQSLITDGAQGGAIPRWSTATDETGVMVGDPGPATIASAFAFGARDFDTSAALRLMLTSALTPGVASRGHEIRPGLSEYLAQGYMVTRPPDTSRPDPSDDFAHGSPSIALEYASSDFAISQFARALGDRKNADLLESHSQNWQNIFNPASGYIHPRLAGSAFEGFFDPASRALFVEGNAAQYTWMIPHNPAGLAAAVGGEKAASDRLDALFEKLDAGPDAPYAFLSNEPMFNTPWLYTWFGEPWRTQQLVRRAMLELFDDTPSGLADNDDLGATSAWYVWASLGLYPTIPGVGGFAVSTPLFPSARLTLGDGRTVVMSAPEAGPDSPYVQGLTVKDVPVDRSWITWDDLASAGSLRFAVGSSPSRWAADYRPPSFQGGQDEALGFLSQDTITLDQGASRIVDLGLVNLGSTSPFQVTAATTTAGGVTVNPSLTPLVAPAGGRATTSLVVTADSDAPPRGVDVTLQVRAEDGTSMPPVVLHVDVRRAPAS